MRFIDTLKLLNRRAVASGLLLIVAGNLATVMMADIILILVGLGYTAYNYGDLQGFGPYLGLLKNLGFAGITLVVVWWEFVNIAPHDWLEFLIWDKRIIGDHSPLVDGDRV